MAEFTSYPAGTPSWVDIQTPDVDATAVFYGALFGWEAPDLGPDAGGYRLFLKGGKPVAGVGPQMMGAAPVAWTTYVNVDDVASSTAKAATGGATVLFGPMDVLDSGKMAVLADPVGGVFALWEPKDHFGASLANESGAFTWSELHTRDTERSAQFYGDLFGWSGKTDDFGGMPYTQWMLGDHEVGGMMGMEPETPAEVGAYWMTYFASDDVDATVARVSELGGNVLMAGTDTPVGRLAVVGDPHGATFSLIQLAAA